MEQKVKQSMFDRPVHASLLTFAAIVIAVAGLRAASSILVPILAAGFISLIISSFVAYLRDTRIPNILAIPITVAVVVGIFAAIGLIITGTAQSASELSGEIQSKLSEQWNQLNDFLSGLLGKVGIDGSIDNMLSGIGIGDIAPRLSSVTSQVGSLLSGGFLLLVFIIFMLLESRELPDKLRVVLGEDSLGNDGRLRKIVTAIQKYLFVKTMVAGLTGTLAGLACLAIGVPYAAFWGFLAFVFDFIPAFGAAFAAIPAGILALIMLGPAEALLTLAAFVAVNAGVGNFIEPRLHSRNQSLSPLFVLLSLVFWGWVFGPVGMLLAVPLSMILKISLEGSDEFREFTVLVSTAKEVNEQHASHAEDETDERDYAGPA